MVEILSNRRDEEDGVRKSIYREAEEALDEDEEMYDMQETNNESVSSFDVQPVLESEGAKQEEARRIKQRLRDLGYDDELPRRGEPVRKKEGLPPIIVALAAIGAIAGILLTMLFVFTPTVDTDLQPLVTPIPSLTASAENSFMENTLPEDAINEGVIKSKDSRFVDWIYLENNGSEEWIKE